MPGICGHLEPLGLAILCPPLLSVPDPTQPHFYHPSCPLSRAPKVPVATRQRRGHLALSRSAPAPRGPHSGHQQAHWVYSPPQKSSEDSCGRRIPEGQKGDGHAHRPSQSQSPAMLVPTPAVQPAATPCRLAQRLVLSAWLSTWKPFLPSTHCHLHLQPQTSFLSELPKPQLLLKPLLGPNGRIPPALIKDATPLGTSWSLWGTAH